MNSLFKKFLKIFLMIYPIFSLEFLYNNYFTLIQIIIILGFLLITIVQNKRARKNIKYIIGYYALIIIYGIFHHLNALDFTSLVPGNFNYNYLDEILYLFKMSIPFDFIYLLYYNDFSKKDFLDILVSWLIIICGSIIITNIFQISLGSYSNTTIKGSIFKWFDKTLIYKEMASRGYFVYANQVSAILVSMVPIVLFFYYKNNLKWPYLVALLLTLLMLGTRISNIAGILVFGSMIFIYIVYSLIKKEPIKKPKVLLTIFLTIIYIFILPYSPTSSRLKIYDYLLDKPLIANSENENISDLLYIKENYEALQINENFILNSYPYEYDTKFWLKILREPLAKRADYRYLEISMVKRVAEINNNKKDIFLGITNDRIQNIFNIERGYVLEYYAYGIIGLVLFLGIYFLILSKNLYNIIKDFSFSNISFLASNILILAISYLSGNIFGSINIFIMELLLIFGYKKPRKA